PSVPGPIPGFRIDDYSSAFDKESVAVFGQVGWRSADDRLSVDVSARYTRDTLDLIATDDAQTLSQPVRFNDSEDFTGFMPKLSVSFRASDDLMLFSTISRGYKSGGFNTAAGQVAGANPVYGKETATNYEVGLKSEFDQRLRLNASVFVMKWDDIQVAQTYQDPTLRFFTFTQNAAKATLKGAEIEITAVPFRNFDLLASLGYNDSKFDDFISAINSDGSRVDASDNRVPFSSKWQASMAGEYSLPIGAGALFLRGEYSYASDFYQTSINRDEIGYFIGSRRTVNARAGWRADRYSITVYGENLGGDDEVYLWDVGNMLSGYQAVVRPERFGVKFTTTF
ncbi:TonB-dependent receptor, partial [Steroidobacter sp.]|uniref:TonB-dependent receptor n=1 Tax=Steroidobacter sp. TaxID=1978227 RepID=UPI001A423DF1